MKNKFSIWQLTPPQILVIGFGLIILIGSCLLSLPLASAAGESIGFLDAFFTSVSATCVTGLVVVDTGSAFTVFGQVVIAVLIQIGGLGFMTMATIFAFAIRKKITLRERLLLQEAFNQGSMEGIVRLIRKVILYSLTIEAIGALFFTVRWSFDLGFPKALYFGIWHAVSMFNNAGFDLFGTVDAPFVSFTGYVNDVVVNVVAVALITLGGIGFIVISDLIDYRDKRKLSLHTKVVLSMSAVLLVVGTLVIFIFEFTNTHTLGSMNFGGKVLSAFFQSAATRTAGPNTVDIGSLRQATQFVMIVLMFIGASPGSTAGGIKTTTFAILLSAVVTMIRGKEDIVIFRYRLAQDRILKAITLSMLALFLVIAVTMILTATEDAQFLKILFEVTSAFGTVGLSTGITPDLSIVGKVMICLTMFAGRLGMITLAYALQPKRDKELFRYPEGKITIG
ncbi:TrkH family potassium uptake protein [Paenibacillus whitsoniae]|uniref:Trk family potassium uptake protein n=1 Tax=Paenibacillus whitsoniae TaxID=2496558 RepID=A0A430JCM8_9BACL|nr:TrkH family potassium uptake protein [Paenibacillus whitsoniae]RTE08806.1 Trk family potassium uptake protein [Paenibacillus whitsoniae]